MDKRKLADLLRQNLHWVVDHEPLDTNFQDRHYRHVNAHRTDLARKLKVGTDPKASHKNHQRAESFICILDEETARRIIKELET